jgi:shikimate dehydrogenase
MRKFGLIGYPLSHSFSKKFFTQKFESEGIANCIYDLYPLKNIDELNQLLAEDAKLEGLNVTIPYKLDVMPFFSEIDDAARNIGAVNCIKVIKDGEQKILKGFNTDAYGFEASLKPLLKNGHNKALVLGDGGAAKAVKYVLDRLSIPFIIVTRPATDNSILYQDLTEDILSEYTIVINTTPLGMSPDVVSAPAIPYEFLSTKHLVYDLVYNPEETTFLNKSKLQGATIKNGLEMLYLQAERSWYIWNN